MNKEVSKGGMIIAIVAGVVILAGVAMYAYNASGGSGNVSADQVKQMQAEAKSQVPKGLEPLTKEEATEGLMTMGGGGKGKH